jgi:hypothetical protein
MSLPICKYCGITGPARTSRCFPKDDKNNQRHDFSVSPADDYGYIERQSGKLGYMCGLAVIYYGCILIDSCSEYLPSCSNICQSVPSFCQSVPNICQSVPSFCQSVPNICQSVPRCSKDLPEKFE